MPYQAINAFKEPEAYKTQLIVFYQACISSSLSLERSRCIRLIELPFT